VTLHWPSCTSSRLPDRSSQRRAVPADQRVRRGVVCELGRGVVNLPGVFAALREIGFQGWAVVELDSVPDASRTPKEANAMSKRYLVETIGLRIP